MFSPHRVRKTPCRTQYAPGREAKSRARTRGTQQVDDPRRRNAAFLELAEGLGLGVAAKDKIKISEISLG